MTTAVIATCGVCGAAVRAVATGHIGHVTIEHESNCLFVLAIEAGAGPEWVDLNGYPIAFERAT